MPIERTIDHDNRIVTTRCVGRMTSDDIQVDQRMFWAQDWVAGYGELFDMRGADVSALVADRSRYAAVVASDEVTDLVPVAMLHDGSDEAQRALSDRYVAGRRAMSSDPACEEFDDVRAAQAWLRSRLHGRGADGGGGDTPAITPEKDLRAFLDRAETSEEAMRASVAATRSILNSAHDAVLGVDVEGRCMFANRRLHELLGADIGSLVGRPVHDTLHRHLVGVNDVDAGAGSDCKFCATPPESGVANFYNEVIRTAGDTFRDIDYESFTIETGAPHSGTIVTLTDITERRVIERRYATLVATLPVGIFTTDASGTVRFANDRFFELLGRREAHVVGAPVVGFVSSEDADLVRRTFDQASVGGKPFAIEHRIELPTGDLRWVLCTGDVDRNRRGDPVGVNGIYADISDLKSTQDELRRLNETLEARIEVRTAELREANDELEASMERLRQTQGALIEREKMAALGALVAGLAHEINTPIGVSVGAASHLAAILAAYDRADGRGETTGKSTAKLRETMGESADLIVSNLARASDLIQRLKRVSVDRAYQDERRFSLCRNIDDTVGILRRQLDDAHVVVDVQCDDDLEIFGDPGVYAQMHTIIVTNALEHAFPDRDGGTIQIEASAGDDVIELVYRDDGVGVDDETRRQLFEPFFTTTRHSGGTGLGLHLLYLLVTTILHGEVKAENNDGLVLTVSVPMVDLRPG